MSYDKFISEKITGFSIPRKNKDYDSQGGGYGSQTQGDYGSQSQGGYGGQKLGGYGSQSQGGYGSQKRGGYGGQDQGGYGNKNETGYGGQNNGGYGSQNEQGYGSQKKGEYGSQNYEGYGADNNGGYGSQNQDGYGSQNQGGYGGNSGGYGGQQQRGRGGQQSGYGGQHDQGGYYSQKSYAMSYDKESSKGDYGMANQSQGYGAYGTDSNSYNYNTSQGYKSGGGAYNRGRGAHRGGGYDGKTPRRASKWDQGQPNNPNYVVRNDNKVATKRKVIVEEVGGGSWINDYDKPLPQEVIAMCTSYHCGVCDIPFTGEEVKKSHYQGKPHERKVDAHLKTLAENAGEPAPKKLKASVEDSPASESKYNLDRLRHFQQAYLDTWASELPDKALEMCRPSRCECCKLNFGNLTEATVHMMGRPHDKKMIEWLQAYCAKHSMEMPQKVSGEALAIMKVSEEGGKHYTCEICSVILADQNTFNIHIQGKKHQKAEKMASQLSSGELDAKLFKCLICNVTAPTQDAMSKHYEGKPHQKKAKAQDEFMNIDAGDGTGLAVGAKKNKTPKQKPQRENKLFECEVCNITCTSKDMLDSHLQGKSHNKKMKSGEEFKCEVCEMSLSSEIMYQSHIEGKKHLNKVKKLNEPQK
eukprot:TRINITY_DN5091_c3_g1_i3.p1 TRINITY_DN5091_c3_g1~~TRINITY_DN5091_c3_g1_i3.p1  ORF type:complete len:640 (-),score=152.80 TRINITY_DN5091_c3_g1_i3:578-2497(-)